MLLDLHTSVPTLPPAVTISRSRDLSFWPPATGTWPLAGRHSIGPSRHFSRQHLLSLSLPPTLSRHTAGMVFFKPVFCPRRALLLLITNIRRRNATQQRRKRRRRQQRRRRHNQCKEEVRTANEVTTTNQHTTHQLATLQPYITCTLHPYTPILPQTAHKSCLYVSMYSFCTSRRTHPLSMGWPAVTVSEWVGSGVTHSQSLVTDSLTHSLTHSAGQCGGW